MWTTPREDENLERGADFEAKTPHGRRKRARKREGRENWTWELDIAEKSRQVEKHGPRDRLSNFKFASQENRV
jgi:hypothetical protein